jgi:DNA-directed RNA polymerase specialized sigma24 family protein
MSYGGSFMLCTGRRHFRFGNAMSEITSQRMGRMRGWRLTAEAFYRLLDWVDEGAGSDGLKYLEMRRRLVAYFDRKNCPTPDELADETLNRVARRLEEEGAIETDTPARYCYIVARFVFMEHLRETQKEGAMANDLRRRSRGDTVAATEADAARELKERWLNCLEQCLNKLEAASREIIARYYVGEARVKIEHRRALAEELGVTMNALSIRACRIRDRLEACVRECAGAGGNAPS